MYRIKHTPHHRTGTKWCIYPLYDFAHGQSDAIEHISHSTCTLEFVAHRPLYNWFIAELGLFPSKQIEFARLNLAYTVMSKRKLLQLSENHLVDGWDDPRLPTIAGLRRRGYTPAAIREFCERIGVSKRDNMTEAGLNQVELWFSKIERDLIYRGVITSVPDLAKKIKNYINKYNVSPKKIKWKYNNPKHRIITPVSNVTATSNPHFTADGLGAGK